MSVDGETRIPDSRTKMQFVNYLTFRELLSYIQTFEQNEFHTLSITALNLVSLPNKPDLTGCVKVSSWDTGNTTEVCDSEFWSADDSNACDDADSLPNSSNSVSE